eukprot:6213941-Pleurochrysis_carterae.AAC.1
MAARTPSYSAQLDEGWRQRVRKEDERAAKPPTKVDPFAHSLSSLVAAESRRGTAGSNLSTTSSRVSSQVSSRVPGQQGATSRATSQISSIKNSKFSQARGRGVSSKGVTLPRTPSGSDTASKSAKQHADDRSFLSSSESAFEPPSTIRSSEPSTIARNKIAELQVGES